MLKAVITGKQKAELIEVQTPRASGDWVLVKVYSAPMCTEYKSFLQGTNSMFLGHEAAGEVVDTGSYTGLKAGDRVVVMPLTACGRCMLWMKGDFIHCQNMRSIKETGNAEGGATYAQYLLKPGYLLMPIPDGISYDMGSLACCALGPTFGAMERMGTCAFDTILITGLGPVGLGGVVNAKYRGACVIAADPDRYRREYAASLGADHVIDNGGEEGAAGALKKIMELTGGVGVDNALDCTGVPAAQRLCIDAARRRGQAAFVGEGSSEVFIKVSNDMIRKGITLIGSWHYNISCYSRIIEVIMRSGSVQRLISHVLPMSRIQEAFELSASPGHAKIILKPWE